MKRRLLESLERRKEQMIASLWANSNWDDDKGTRRNALEELEENFSRAASLVISGTREQEEEQIDADNPFFKAAERGMKKIETPRNDEGTVRQVIEAADQF